MNVLILKTDATGQALDAARSYRPDEIVLDFAEVEWRPMRDRYTVQHPSGVHLYNAALAKVSHSCEPNCRLMLAGRLLVAARHVAAGDAITFDYQTTETRFAYPFQCLCGSSRCRGWIG